jgi:hypothetical protein
MGANATTFVPAYVAGEVLTAADLSVTNSGIPVFATTVTRDAAFGGTGEKTLAEGQYAYIEATNATQFYDGAAWQTVGSQGLAIFNETQASGTEGGTPGAAGSFHKRTLNTTVVNTISGCSIASSVITLPAGTYQVSATSPHYLSSIVQIRLRNTTDSTDTVYGSNGFVSGSSAAQANVPMIGYFTIAASKNFELQYRNGTATALNGLGVSNTFGTSEIYAIIQIEKVA